MNMGIAGVGRIGSMHAGVLANHPAVDQLLVYDEDRERAAQVAAQVGGKPASSAEELLSNIDGLVVATATAGHAELVRQSTQASVPVFCEKPVALTLEETAEVLGHVTATGVPVQVGFQRRFDPGYCSARRAVQEGELGELRRLHVVSADPAPPDSSFIASSGGIFRDLHIHDFDAVRWVSGREVVEVHAFGANRGAAFFAEANDVDECVATLVLDNGTLATLQGSRYNGAGYDVRLEAAGTEGTYVAGLAERSPFHSSEPGVRFPEGPPWTLFSDRFKTAYADQITAFVEVARGRRESPCDIGDALEAFRVAEAAERSVRERRPVRIDEIVVRAS
jgi:myo-inositol 2-dehydrogenase/D-chiro-inositol 1-dehydrogenase